MLSDDAAADNWKAWLDDLPLDAGFAEGVDQVQDFISGTIARADAAEAEAATLRARLARMEGALEKAANRLDWAAGIIESDKARNQVGEWADEARAALTDGGSNG